MGRTLDCYSFTSPLPLSIKSPITAEDAMDCIYKEDETTGQETQPVWLEFQPNTVKDKLAGVFTKKELQECIGERIRKKQWNCAAYLALFRAQMKEPEDRYAEIMPEESDIEESGIECIIREDKQPPPEEERDEEYTCWYALSETSFGRQIEDTDSDTPEDKKISCTGVYTEDELEAYINVRFELEHWHAVSAMALILGHMPKMVGTHVIIIYE